MRSTPSRIEASWRAFGDWLNAVADRIAPPRETDVPGELERVRFIVLCWLIGGVVVVVFGVLNATNGLWGQFALQVAGLPLGAVALGILRRSRNSELAGQLSLATMTLCFALGGLMQTPLEPTTVMFTALVPMIALYFLDLRWAFVWTLITIAVGVTVLALGSHGVTVKQADPAPGLTMALNFVFMVVVAVAFIAVFARQRDRAMESVRRADRAKSAFLANVSHEIRTPMNGVLGMAELMLNEPMDPAQRERLAVVLRSGQGMVSLINDLLDLTKIEAGKLEPEPAPLDLYRLLGDIETLFRPLAQRKGLTLVVHVEKDVPRTVVGDGLRLRQVLSNLVSNAIKFTDAGEVGLRLSKGAHPGSVAFAVKDTGAGIPDEHQARLFRAFEQLDVSTTRRHGGTGLGLTLSKELVALLGGSLALTSELGKGAQFSFELPLPGSDVALEPEPATQLPPPTSPLPALVVDDNPINLRVAKSMMERFGWTVETAQNGKEALMAMSTKRFAVVLMDCHMPEMDGFEATARIRTLEGPAGATPILAITASALPEDLEACRKVGMNDCLAKPVTMDRLRDALSRLLPAAPQTP